MGIPDPTPIYRITHIDNLETCLRRGGLWSPNDTAADGLPYRTIHNPEIQRVRRARTIPCGPGGLIHDYVAFYFGPRSPMLYQLHTGWVTGYDEGQTPIIYLVSTAQAVQQANVPFVFSDGHGIATYTSWFDCLDDLNSVDWDTVYCKWWRGTVDDMDRQRRKQAEFLIHRRCDWDLVQGIGVLNATVQARVESTLDRFDPGMRRPVATHSDWYY